MKINNIENKLNIGIPCYNQTLLKVKSLTLNCHIKGLGNKAIDSEKELRMHSKNFIESELGVKDIPFSDGLYQYASTGANVFNSSTSFGFNITSKLSSLFYKNLKEPICGLNIQNIDELSNERIKSKNDIQLENLYNIRKKLLEQKYRSLEEQYFHYLDENAVLKYVLEKQCKNILYLVNKNDLINAQKYLFLLSAYKEIYGDLDLNIDNTTEKLSDFIKTMNSKYQLKDEYLLRDGFLNKTKEENQKIIDSIISKDDIILNGDLCESGKITKKRSSVIEHKKREEISLEDKKNIEREINDRRMFYLSNGPIGEIITNGTFNKYGAFVYSNGIIVADRLYSVNTLDSLKQNAIYKFTSLNFEELKNLTKQELVGNKVYHTSTWKDRIGQYINQETDTEMEDKAKELVKKKYI